MASAFALVALAPEDAVKAFLSHSMFIFEALEWVPSMGWGMERSLGHDVDLFGAALGLTLFPLGYLLGGLKRSP